MEERIERFERMLRDVTTLYDDATEKMANLKAQGKEKSATYRQLMGNRMIYKNIILMYQTYGLL